MEYKRLCNGGRCVQLSIPVCALREVVSLVMRPTDLYVEANANAPSSMLSIQHVILLLGVREVVDAGMLEVEERSLGTFLAMSGLSSVVVRYRYLALYTLITVRTVLHVFFNSNRLPAAICSLFQNLFDVSHSSL